MFPKNNNSVEILALPLGNIYFPSEEILGKQTRDFYFEIN